MAAQPAGAGGDPSAAGAGAARRRLHDRPVLPHVARKAMPVADKPNNLWGPTGEKGQRLKMNRPIHFDYDQHEALTLDRYDVPMFSSFSPDKKFAPHKTPALLPPRRGITQSERREQELQHQRLVREYRVTLRRVSAAPSMPCETPRSVATTTTTAFDSCIPRGAPAPAPLPSRSARNRAALDALMRDPAVGGPGRAPQWALAPHAATKVIVSAALPPLSERVRDRVRQWPVGGAPPAAPPTGWAAPCTAAGLPPPPAAALPPLLRPPQAAAVPPPPLPHPTAATGPRRNLPPLPVQPHAAPT